ncbi:hypothetical protein GCM10023149_45370 [Mucilaginibacter gynuensis]|uniref:Uncharacterized protein n=1 Tax=Mucilaginibacter gynuensis TaxID=1302236 RepID=A0ABP8HAP9_9SPHI
MKFNKNCVAGIASLFISVTALAQDTQSGKLSPYVFPEFVTGTVLQKGGASLEASLNYNTITEEMMFEKDGQKLVLDQGNIIDTIYLNKRKFIPARQVFFEKITNTLTALFVQHRGKAIKSNFKSNNENQAASMNAKKAEAPTVDKYALLLPDGYVMQTDDKYWLQKGMEFIPLTSLKKIIDQFAGKEAQIENFVKDNNISLNKAGDLIKLIEFCNK